MNKRTKISLNVSIKAALLGVMAFIIMLFEFILPFVPSFLKLDLSEIPVLIGGFALGPVAAIGIEFIKIVLNLLFNGTITGGIGELANFIIGVSFVVPAAIIYKRKKNLKHALFGMGVGVISMTVFACLANYFFVLPLYAKLMPMDAIISAAAGVNKFVTDYNSLVLFVFAPFNLVKGILISIICLPLYKRLSPILHRGINN